MNASKTENRVESGFQQPKAGLPKTSSVRHDQVS